MITIRLLILITTLCPLAFAFESPVVQFYNNYNRAGASEILPSPILPSTFGSNDNATSIRYLATLVAPTTGNYRIKAGAGHDHVVFLDGKRLSGNGNNNTSRTTVSLKQGQKYGLRIDGREKKGKTGTISFKWKVPGSQEWTVPSSPALLPPQATAQVPQSTFISPVSIYGSRSVGEKIESSHARVTNLDKYFYTTDINAGESFSLSSNGSTFQSGTIEWSALDISNQNDTITLRVGDRIKVKSNENQDIIAYKNGYSEIEPEEIGDGYIVFQTDEPGFYSFTLQDRNGFQVNEVHINCIKPQYRNVYINENRKATSGIISEYDSAESIQITNLSPEVGFLWQKETVDNGLKFTFSGKHYGIGSGFISLNSGQFIGKIELTTFRYHQTSMRFFHDESSNVYQEYKNSFNKIDQERQDTDEDDLTYFKNDTLPIPRVQVTYEIIPRVPNLNVLIDLVAGNVSAVDGSDQIRSAALRRPKTIHVDRNLQRWVGETNSGQFNLLVSENERKPKTCYSTSFFYDAISYNAETNTLYQQSGDIGPYTSGIINMENDNMLLGDPPGGEDGLTNGNIDIEIEIEIELPPIVIDPPVFNPEPELPEMDVPEPELPEPDDDEELDPEPLIPEPKLPEPIDPAVKNAREICECWALNEAKLDFNACIRIALADFVAEHGPQENWDLFTRGLWLNEVDRCNRLSFQLRFNFHFMRCLKNGGPPPPRDDLIS